MFPDGFYFGASTSSHQVEGKCRNDWTVWEKQNAKRLAVESVKYKNLPSWDVIEKQALDPDNYISGVAVDHYNRYPEDIDIAKKIGINAYRFSIEWSRIEPQKGVWDSTELDHYKKMIGLLRKRSIEPFVTIWHWTLPLWLSENGGLMHPDFPELFARYAVKLAQEFSGNVKFFILINEPEIYSLNSYLRGIWPPQKKSIIKYLRVINTLIKSHKLAFKEIKKIIPGSMIGTACNMSYFETGNGPVNRFIAYASELLWNRYFIDRVTSFVDFIGVNYYFHNRINYGFNKNRNIKMSDMGWELYPEGILPLLSKLKKYKLPVYITENGLADSADNNRAWFIEITLRSVLKSIIQGVDVRGYFHWSLLDNFEWDKGFWPRFGLISVDRKNLSRKIRSKSVTMYKQIITKGLEI
jgi:beta-glucosidase